MMNCNCFSDWDHSLLFFNLVYGSYFNLWMNCYFFMRGFMMLYCCYNKDHDAQCPYFIFIDVSLSKHVVMIINFDFSLEGKRGLSLGELICPICIMISYYYFLCFWSLFYLMIQYLCLFSLILQGLHEEGECRQLEFWTQEKHVRDTYSAQLQWRWNFTENIFTFNKKY